MSLSEPLALEHFLPYRFSIVTNRMSRQLSHLYATRFDLGIPEWRIMAVLGRSPDLSAEALCSHTQMDKVAVSRAVNRLIGQGRLLRRYARDDRRRSQLRLSAQGRRIYEQIVPMAREYEARVVAEFSERELQMLNRLLKKLDAATETDC